MKDIEFTVTKPLTDLQLTKDSSVQGVPLTNEVYEKELDGNDTTTHYIPHLTNINTNENIEEPLDFIKRISKEDE